MGNFFTSSRDLGEWIRRQNSPDGAARKIIAVIGENNEQDIIETCRKIYRNDKNAEDVLYKILASYNITEPRETGEANMSKENSSDEKGLKKEAQAVMRQDSLYGNLPMKVCPKLPKQSAGQQLISTYNCRTYCLDSMVLDENPDKVYCLEAIWRRHIMDKFAREFKDKNGKWVGGYINERFQAFHDDGGNQMQLANGEKSRQPRPHEWSVERRMEEQRGNKTKSIVLNASVCEKLSKTASNEEAVNMFLDAIEMHSDGLSDEDAIGQLAEHYNKPIDKTASVYYAALKKIKAESQNAILYSYDNSGVVKKAQNVPFAPNTSWVTTRETPVSLNGKMVNLPAQTPVVALPKSDRQGNPVFHAADGELANQEFTIQNLNAGALESIDDLRNGEKIQDAANEVGLNEEVISEDPNIPENEFAIDNTSNK